MHINKIKEFFDIRVQQNISEEFKLYNLKTNLSRGKLIAAATLAIEIFIIISSLIFKGGVRDEKDVYYYIMYMIFVIVVAFFLIALIKMSEHPKVGLAGYFIVYSFSAFMLAWNMVISLLDGKIISYVIALMAISIIALLKPMARLIIYIAVHVVYIILLFAIESSSDSIFVAMINTTIAMVVSWLAGYIVYKSRAENFSSQSEVETQRAELEVLNSELEDLNAELNCANKKLEYLSRTDGLTGIYNRRMFDEISNSFWEECRNCSSSLAVIMIDIDHFKIFNDTYGHQKGDECLKSIVAKIKEVIPNDSVLARYGGEEFAILLENCSMSRVQELAEDIRAKVAGMKMPHENSQVKPYVTLSLGVYCASPGENTIDEFIGFADKALYKAKQNGRDRVEVLQMDKIKDLAF